MSQDISFIKKTLKGHVEVDSPFDLRYNDIVSYITLRDNEEYFHTGGNYIRMGDNVIILKDNGKIRNVPLSVLDKGGNVLHKTRIWCKENDTVSYKSRKEYEEIIYAQQSIIEKMTKNIKTNEIMMRKLYKENETLRNRE